MVIPTFLIVPCFLAAFGLFCWSYYVRDPVNRVTDLRFLLAVLSLAMALVYGYLNFARYPLSAISGPFFLTGAALLVLSFQMVRRPARHRRGS
jgi:hypothetical protein